MTHRFWVTHLDRGLQFYVHIVVIWMNLISHLATFSIYLISPGPLLYFSRDQRTHFTVLSSRTVKVVRWILTWTISLFYLPGSWPIHQLDSTFRPNLPMKILEDLVRFQNLWSRICPISWKSLWKLVLFSKFPNFPEKIRQRWPKKFKNGLKLA